MVDAANKHYGASYADARQRLDEQLEAARHATTGTELTRLRYESGTPIPLQAIRKRIAQWRAALDGASREVDRLLGSLAGMRTTLAKVPRRILWQPQVLWLRLYVVLLWLYTYRWRLLSAVAIVTLIYLYAVYHEAIWAYVNDVYWKIQTYGTQAQPQGPSTLGQEPEGADRPITPADAIP